MQISKQHIPFIGILLAISLIFNACKTKNQKDTKEISVIAELVGFTSVEQNVSVSGNIEGNKTVKLGFMVAGKINQINVAEGQNISIGQLIATLDPTHYAIAKEMADIQVAQTTDEYNRLKAMYDRNSISDSDFKNIDFALQAAKAQQKLHNQNLSDTRLYAPFSGVLLKKLSEKGEIINQGMPVLVLSDISKIKVNAYIPENQLNQIHLGQIAHVQIGALGESFEGKIIEVGSVADATTRAFTAKIEVDNPELKIQPGMTAEVTIPSSKEKSVLAIPASAILRTPEGWSFVFIADKGQAFQRNVSIGAVYSDKIEILSGLSAGEILITGGQHKLTNGSKISITNKE